MNDQMRNVINDLCAEFKKCLLATLDYGLSMSLTLFSNLKVLHLMKIVEIVIFYCKLSTMKKYARRNILYDRMHKSFVVVCIGLTLYGSVLLGDHFYKYYRYVKPEIDAKKAQAERELLSEGSADKLLSE